MSELVKEVTFDLEWINLIRQAKDLGISIEEIREFLANFSANEND